MYMKWWMASSSTPRKRNWIKAGLIALALAVASGCSLLPAEGEEEVLPTINPPKISKKPEYTVTTDTLISYVRGTGKLMSMQEEDVFFTLDNKPIKAVYVNIGDEVQAGQLIAELDVSDLGRQLRTKQLQARSDELAMIEILRNATDKSAAELEQARIDFELKRQELVELEEMIAQAKITAPFSGTVVAVNKKVGEMSKAYESVATISDLTKLTVAANITSKSDLEKVAPGMEVEVDINTAGKHKGVVKALPNPNSSQNPGGGWYPYEPVKTDSIDNYLIVELEKMPENVSRGTPLSVAIVVEKKENVTVIPLSALRSISGRNYVQVVDEAGNKREVDVEIGMQTSTLVEIVKGLTPGQKVVGR